MEKDPSFSVRLDTSTQTVWVTYKFQESFPQTLGWPSAFIFQTPRRNIQSQSVMMIRKKKKEEIIAQYL